MSYIQLSLVIRSRNTTIFKPAVVHSLWYQNRNPHWQLSVEYLVTALVEMKFHQILVYQSKSCSSYASFFCSDPSIDCIYRLQIWMVQWNER